MNWRYFLVVLTLSGIFDSTTQASETDGTWLRDVDSNCAIWNAEPRPNEAFSWSGSCEAGIAGGEGVLQWFENDKPTERYEGSMLDGKPHGLGSVTLPDGEKHEAKSVGGVFQGQGKVSWLDGVYCKVMYVNGEIDGQAFCYHPNGDVTAHLFQSGQQVRRDPQKIIADEN